jgi:hypothetical protein
MAYYSRYITRMKKVACGVLLLQLALTGRTLLESWLSSTLVLMVSQVTPTTHLSSFLLGGGVNVDPTLKLVSICKFSSNSKHDPDLKIKKVIMPTFISPRLKKWSP